MKILGSASTAMVLLLLAAPLRAEDSFGAMAKTIVEAAGAEGVRRVAVIPLRPSSGRDRQGGAAISERLASAILKSGALTLIDRRSLGAVLAEQRLGALGHVDPRQAASAGRILGAEAIVTGTFVPLSGGRSEIHVRLIHSESSQVLGSATARIRKDWDEDFMPAAALWDVSIPENGDFPAPLVRLVPDPFRDAPNDSPCAGWEDEADRLQGEVLPLQARFWAARLRQPEFDIRSLAHNPGSDIRSAESRRRFYTLLRTAFDRAAPALSRAESDTLAASERAAAQLIERCR